MRTSITHPLNVAYLVVGLVFLGISGSWALQEADLVDSGDVSWLLPAVLVAAGVIGLVAMAAKGLSRRGADGADLPHDPYGPSDQLPSDLYSSDLYPADTSSDLTDGDPR